MQATTTARSGLVFSVWAAIFYAGMAAFLYAIKLREPAVSFWATSFVRIEINLVVLLIIAAWRGTLGRIWGDGASTLWWRGVFGTISILMNFSSLRLIGIGESAFLYALSAVFIALLSPWFLEQHNNRVVWVAILGSLVGAYFIMKPWEGTGDLFGRGLALGSGFFAALAYLMIAKTGNRYSSTTIVFYFCLVATLVHLAIIAVFGVTWPQDIGTMLFLLAAGVLGTGAQICVTKSFQTAHAALNAAVSYLTPVLSLLLQMLVFANYPDPMSIVGAAIILSFGVALPFLRPQGRVAKSV